MTLIPCEQGVDSMNDAPKDMKLTGLDDDCLEFLFGYLEWDDLLNIADSSKLFHTAVCLVFKRKYHKSKVIIDKSSSKQRCNTIFVKNPGTALKFLRNFGHLIWNLQLNCRFFASEIIAEFTRYLAEYCSKTLHSLSFIGNSSKFPFDKTETIFTNVAKLNVQLCEFGHDSKLQIIFPNVRFLNLGANWYKNKHAMGQNFPPVRDLTIQANKFEENEIKDLIRMNSQLERLEICPIYSMKLIEWINEYLPKLQCLELRGLPREFYIETHTPIQLDHIVHLALHVDNVSIRNIPFSCKQLRNLLVGSLLNLNQKCLDFFGSLQHLKLLTLLGWYDDQGNIQKFFELKNILSTLEELTFNLIDHISSDCVLRFLERSQCLRKMTIKVNRLPNETIEIISKRLNSDWQMQEGIFDRWYIIERIEGK